MAIAPGYVMIYVKAMNTKFPAITEREYTLRLYSCREIGISNFILPSLPYMPGTKTMYLLYVSN